MTTTNELRGPGPFLAAALVAVIGAVICGGCEISMFSDSKSSSTRTETILEDGSTLVQIDNDGDGIIDDTFVVPGPSNFDEHGGANTGNNNPSSFEVENAGPSEGSGSN